MFGINYDPVINMLPLAAPGSEEPGCEASPRPPLAPQPSWVGPPKDGVACGFTGLERGTFQTKVLGSFGGCLVRVSLHQRGAERGKQIVFTPSLHNLLLWTSAHPGELPTFTPDFREARNAPVDRRWIRAPKNQEHCGFTSLGHYSFYALIEEAGTAIQIARLQLPSQTRASLLVWLPSLHNFLVHKAEAQFAKSGDGRGRTCR